MRTDAQPLDFRLATLSQTQLQRRKVTAQLMFVERVVRMVHSSEGYPIYAIPAKKEDMSMSEK